MQKLRATHFQQNTQPLHIRLRFIYLLRNRFQFFVINCVLDSTLCVGRKKNFNSVFFFPLLRIETSFQNFDFLKCESLFFVYRTLVQLNFYAFFKSVEVKFLRLKHLFKIIRFFFKMGEREKSDRSEASSDETSGFSPPIKFHS